MRIGFRAEHPLSAPLQTVNVKRMSSCRPHFRLFGAGRAFPKRSNGNLRALCQPFVWSEALPQGSPIAESLIQPVESRRSTSPGCDEALQFGQGLQPQFHSTEAFRVLKLGSRAEDHT